VNERKDVEKVSNYVGSAWAGTMNTRLVPHVRQDIVHELDCGVVQCESTNCVQESE
jgi:hypothetical protein